MFNPENKFTEADRLLLEVKVHLAKNEQHKAFLLLVQLTRKFPEFGKAWFELGNIMLHALEDIEGAIECYKTAVDVSPDYTHAYLAYADVLFLSAKFAEMNAILNQVMEITGVRKDIALQKSAMLLESQSRYDEAIETYIKALLSCYSDETIIEIEKGISRCNTKKKYQ